MKNTINFYEFETAFRNLRPENFSYDGLKALFDWYEMLEEECGTEIELDVIAICCDWTEYDNYYQAVDAYGTDCYDTLSDNTIVLETDSNSVVVANY